MSDPLIPVLTFSFGLIASYFAISFDLRKARNQELVKKRLQIYDTLAPMLNDLLCHITCRGNWKEITPQLAISHKRMLDRNMYLYGPFFSQKTFFQYNTYIHCCFSTFRGPGKPAQLRASKLYLKSNWGKSWNIEWEEYYASEKEAIKLEMIQREYRILIDFFAGDVGVAPPNIASKIREKIMRARKRNQGIPQQATTNI